GNPAAADHQRSGPRQHVCPGGLGLHHGVRHHQPDQLRARRGADGGRAHQLGDHRDDAGVHAGASRLAGADRRHAHFLRRRRRPEFRHREGRLPAAAQQPQAGTADHRDRHVDPAADAGDDHLQAQLQAVPHAAAGRADPVRRRGDHAHPDHDPGPDGSVAGHPDVPGELHAPGPGHARHGGEPARGRADGRQARHGHLRHLHHRCSPRHHRRHHVCVQLRHGAAHHGFPARAQGVHRRGVRRHRQPGRRGDRRDPARADRVDRFRLHRHHHRRRPGQPLQRHLRVHRADHRAHPAAVRPAGRTGGGPRL
ncbi:MAG: High-affinity branched-chain amino acid transport system permease protein LivH, partial [uncultured Ramlibacter sp.]